MSALFSGVAAIFFLAMSGGSLIYDAVPEHNDGQYHSKDPVMEHLDVERYSDVSISKKIVAMNPSGNWDDLASGLDVRDIHEIGADK